MKSLKCNDLGGTCDFEVTGKTENEVIKKMMKHGKKFHKEEMKKMSKGELLKKMRDNIHEFVESK